MFHKFENRLGLSGDLVAETALRIGAGRSIEPVGTDLPVVRDALGKPYIPGSSFKGVLRSRVEQLVRAQVSGKTGACDPLDLKEGCCISSECMEELKEEAAREARDEHSKWYRKRDEYLTQKILKKMCLVCQLFGSPWFASRVQVRDLLVDEDLWFDQFQIRDGVAIDRDTETAGEGKLYSFEVVSAGARFKCEIMVENAEDWQLGMLMMGLLPFERGEVALGGGVSRGLGRVRVHWKDRRYFAVDGDLEKYFGFIQGSYPGEDIEEDGTLVHSWIDAFKCKIREMKGSESGGDKCTKD